MQSFQKDTAYAATKHDAPNAKGESPFFQTIAGQNNVLNLLATIEKPSVYQLNFLENAANKIKEELTGKNLGVMETIRYINDRLTELFPQDANKGDSILLKDIVLVKAGASPKGNIDCDSRSLLIYSVMQKLGKEKELAITELTGHAMLYVPSSQIFFETLNSTEKQKGTLTERELLELNILDTPQKIMGFVYSNMATSVASEVQAEENARIFFHKTNPSFDLAEKKKEAEQLFNKALELNPDQITLRKNYITTYESDFKKAETVALMHQSIIITLENNYRSRWQDLSTLPNKTSSSGDEETTMLRTETVRAAYIDYGMFCQYKKNDFAKSAEIFERLFDAADKHLLFNSRDIETFKNDLKLNGIAKNIDKPIIDKIASMEKESKNCVRFKEEGFEEEAYVIEKTRNDELNIYPADGFALMMLLDACFTNKEYDRYVAVYDNNKHIIANGMWDAGLSNIEQLANQRLVSELITGKEKLTPESRNEFIKAHGNSELIEPIINHTSWNFSQFTPVEALKAWEGYPEFERILLNKK